MKLSQNKRWLVPLLFTVGVIAMVGGAIDPLEGAFVILSGCGLITLSRWLGVTGRPLAVYWSWLLGLMVLGVTAMVGLSAIGGIGGRSGHSLWWGLLLLPYPIGWILGIANLVSRLIERARWRGAEQKS